ncbi:MAG: LppX_LprAFG lipoprotein, partial [Chloroflexota bacterium]|nr:LppX_LprAFG lipoprotein [Chloroflexota bacterium]
MITLKKGTLFVAFAMLLLLMSACGSTATTPGTGSGGSNNGSSSQTPSQVLQKSFTAMQQLKSAHFDMNLSDTTSVTGVGATPTSGSGSTPRQIAITATGSGDEALPGKSSLKLMLNLGAAANGKNYNFNEIVIDKQLYVQNSKGQWYVIDESKMTGANPAAGTNASAYNKLLQIAQKAKLTDHGMENVNGQNLRHITATFGNDALQQLLSATGQGNSQAASAINLQQATFDVWVDEATSYTHKIELKLALGVNSPTPTASGSKSGASTSLDITLNYSKFNDPVTISAPANAIPTTNIL